MNMVRRPGMLRLSTALAILFCISGCDNGPDVSEAVSYFDSHPLEFTHTDISTYSLAITWEDTALQTEGLTADGQVAVLSAGGGTPPYQWDVQDVSLGTIIDQEGPAAAYQRNAAGDNVVILKDSAGNEAYTAVSQP